MKALVTSKSFAKHAPEALELLRAAGIELAWISKPSPPPERIAAEIGDADCLIVGNDTVDAAVLDAAPRLKLVHMNGTGLDAIDVEAASERGILVANAPGANRNAVAELAVALMLMAGRDIERHAESLAAGKWERSAGRELSGKTVGLIGLGNIGRRVVELLAGFEDRFVGYDPCPDRAWAAARKVELAPSYEAVFAAADYLVLTAPLTPETEGLANAARLELMKPTAYIVNTARGGLVDEAALCEAVRTGRIAGAALDAFREEPLPLDSPLRMRGITLTPHLAATSVESAAAVSMIVARNVISVLAEGRYDAAVNAEAASRRGLRARG